jgi:hypothetical protein
MSRWQPKLRGLLPKKPLGRDGALKIIAALPKTAGKKLLCYSKILFSFL